MFRSVSFSSRKKSTFVKNIQVKTFLKKCILVLDSNAVFGNKQLKIYNFTDFKAFFSKSIIFTAFTVFAAEWPPWKMSFKLEFFLLPLITLTPISSLTLFQELSVLHFASINILPNIHFIHHIPKSESSNSIKLQPRYIKSRTSTGHYVFQFVS